MATVLGTATQANKGTATLPATQWQSLMQKAFAKELFSFFWSARAHLLHLN